MADILNQALKDANYGVSGKNSGPAVYYKITSYSMTRPSATSDTINYSIKLDAYMSKGGFMGAYSNMTLTLSMYAGANKEYTICSAKTIKSTSDSWKSSSDTSPVKSGITVTGTFNAPNLSGDVPVWFITERTNGTTIGSGEVTNSSYTMNFPAKSYTVTFDANGGTIANPSSITKSNGAALGTLPTTSRTGYTFNGWYTAKTGGTKISTTTKVTGNVTYYAQWEPMHNHVNINNTWVPCTIKVNVVGEGYEYIGLTSDFRDLQSFDEDMYYQYGIPLQGNEDIFTAVQTGHYPEYGVSVDSIPDNSWGGYDGEIVPWELYMKSNNVKQWVDCEVQSLKSLI